MLEAIRDGHMDVEEGLARFRAYPVQDLGHTQLDTHREVRCGDAEVIYGEGKSPEQLVEIARAALEHHERLLVTRATPAGAAKLCAEMPRANHHPVSRTVTFEPAAQKEAAWDFIDAVIKEGLPFARGRQKVALEFDRRFLSHIMALHGGNVSRASAASGISRRYFYMIKAKQ